MLTGEFFQAFFHAHTSVVLIVDAASGAIVNANPAAAIFYGYTQKELCTLNVQIFSGHAFDLLLPDFQESGQQRHIQHRLKGGELRDVTVFSSPVAYEGKRYLLLIVHDVTDYIALESELRLRTQVLDSLQATILAISSPHELSALLNLIVERAASLLGASSGGLYLTEASQKQVRCVVSYQTQEDFRGTVLAYGEGAAGHVAETGQPLVIDDYSVWAGRASVFDRGHPFQAVMSAPLLWQGNVTGVIHVLREGDGKNFTQKELDLLCAFADHAAVAVENSRLVKRLEEELHERKRIERELQAAKETLEAVNQELAEALQREQEYARTDGLTGILNRRYLFELVEREFDVACRYNAPLSMLIFDIDDFKQVNDHFGHAVGDVVLKRITKAVGEIIRAPDIFGRYGGDEFIIVMPQTRLAEAKPVARRMHAKIAETVVLAGEAQVSVRISIGISEIVLADSRVDTVEALFKRADEALYLTKKSGKNNTAAHSSSAPDAIALDEPPHNR